jgi:hypothetical protein
MEPRLAWRPVTRSRIAWGEFFYPDQALLAWIFANLQGFSRIFNPVSPPARSRRSDRQIFEKSDSVGQSPNSKVGCVCDVRQVFEPASAGDFPVAGAGNTGLESPANPQAGMPALHCMRRSKNSAWISDSVIPAEKAENWNAEKRT